MVGVVEVKLSWEGVGESSVFLFHRFHDGNFMARNMDMGMVPLMFGQTMADLG